MFLSNMTLLPILDLYVLAMLDRGLESPYDLQRHGGLSLGASTPALKRLKKADMVTRKTDRSKGKRVRFQYGLTPTGRREAQDGWREYLKLEPPSDIDAVLRVIDLASQYRLPRTEVIQFAENASMARLRKSNEAQQESQRLAITTTYGYPVLRAECESARLAAEGKTLKAIAQRLRQPKTGRQNPSRRRFPIVDNLTIPGL